nr:MAP7 domain-containing protein 1-like [Aegilops tauschii subsp. strangulata]
MPVLSERELELPAPTGASVAEAPVMVSSGESGEEERPDSEATLEGAGETSPLRMANLLRTFPDEEEAGEHPVRDSPGPAGVTTRSGGTPSKEPPAGVPKKSRSALISRGDASAPSPAGAAAGPAAVPLPAPGARVPVPQPMKPPVLVLQKRPREYAPVDQVGDGSLASASGTSLQDPEARPREKAISAAKLAPESSAPSSPAEAAKAQESPAPSTAANLQTLVPMSSLPLFVAPLGRYPPASPNALEDALLALTQLREDLQGADRRLAAGRLELISGWLRSDASVRAAWGQAMAASEEGKRATDLAAAAREVALKDDEAAKERCRVAEAELETLCNECTAEVRQHGAREEKLKAREDAVVSRDAELEQLARAQTAEHDRLGKLEKKVEAEKAQLEVKAKVLAEDRVAFKTPELKSREALRELYGKGLKKPLVTDEEGPTKLLPQLLTALEGVVNGIGPMVEGNPARSPLRP